MNTRQSNRKNWKRDEDQVHASFTGNDLMRDIKKDAEEEAGRLVADTQKTLSQRREDLSRQTLAIREEAERAASRQIEQITKSSDSALVVERRRMRLKVRDKMLQEIIRAVEKRFVDMIREQPYVEVLAGWIVEAAIGLGCDVMTVNTSAVESVFVTDKLLADAQKNVHELTGRTVSLKKSGEQPLLGQGVILQDASGALAFNNCVHTRLLRYQSEIRAMIFDGLFGDESADS